MNAVTAFAHRQEQLLEQLEHTENIEQAIACCTMALEQTACELAQDEQDELARQRQQAVMACARRAPQLLRAVQARGELVLGDEKGKSRNSLRGAKALGAFLLAALAVHKIVDGSALFAALQLIGGALLVWGGQGHAVTGLSARAEAVIDAKEAVRLLRELCQAADVCVSDLMLLEHDAGMTRLSGTADEAMLDLLVALMEARQSGRNELAMRSLAQAEQYLRMLGIDVVFYDAEHAALFECLPTMGEARTIRPALLRDGQVLRRGTAACRVERSAGA